VGVLACNKLDRDRRTVKGDYTPDFLAPWDHGYACICTLENTSIGSGEYQQQDMGGTSKGGANNHLSVKVSPPSLSLPVMP
jgi:hypothetical protein